MNLKSRTPRLLILSAVLITFFDSQTHADSPFSEAMRSARSAAQWQPRRIMYNDDGNHVTPFTTPDELIDLRLRQLIGTQVDTIAYCTGGGGLFWGHQAHVGETLGEFVTENDGQQVRDIVSSLDALKALGTDPLAVAVDFGHENGMEVFWSYRMNNIEDSFAAPYLSRWKREHPDFLFGKAEDYPKYEYTDPKKWWAGLDFAEAEVRDYALRIFEDVFTRYDIDGIDMDWFRHPQFFRETRDEKPVTAEHLALMNDFVRKVRALSEKVGAARGRPLLISARVPLSVERCRFIGLDVTTWLEEGLVDILTFGGDLGPMAMAPQLKEMVDLAHKHKVLALANIGGSGLQPNTGYYSEEAWWGAAANAWHVGVDGIYTFNLFPESPKAQYRHIGSPETLKGLDKIYAIDPVQPKDFWGFDRSALVVPDRLPITLEPGERVRFKLPVGESVVDYAPAGKRAEVTLRMWCAALAGDSFAITLNGADIGAAKPTVPLTEVATPTWFELVVEPGSVLAGTNLIEVLWSGTSREVPVAVERMELRLRYVE